MFETNKLKKRKMNKILVANRGEIAVRIIRSLKAMGITSVAVYSEADRNSIHVKMADEAYLLGPAPSNQSYLLGDKIIDIAKKNNIDGIHPGYGFLSENAEFAKKVTDAGIIFIGPKPESITLMGSKLAAKETVSKYDIPLIPGTDHAIDDIEEAKEIAEKIGFPILIKASAGGGGKGMRIVENKKEFESQLKMAINEAKSAFGDGSVFIEKYIGSPRHIEIQILADNYGNTIYLNERECSIQRRHQKVIEEAPSAIVTPKIREKLGKAAVYVAKSCDYVGAGTVEFLMDENLNFYFLEMNTRLQVEHPVTEYTTGLDLVEEQIRIARGEKLRYEQKDIGLKGHAIELRVYAEDPENSFLPSIGNLEQYKEPTGKNIRVDSGFEQGMDIPIYYDPMISKLIVYGKDRDHAIAMMQKAINDYKIKGIRTTLSFGEFVMKHEAFKSGKFDTNFVKYYFTKDKIRESIKESSFIAALFAVKDYLRKTEIVKEPVQG